jgi:capsid protein
LALFAQLRRYTLAVISAAETAANFSAVLQANCPAGSSPEDIAAMDVISLERNMATTLPMGWSLGQLKAEQPTTTYGEFKREILNEIARCLQIPFNIAAGNSSGYNYASGRLDHQDFYKAIVNERSYFNQVAMEKIWRHWFREARVVYGIKEDHIEHEWFYDGLPHVDPTKEAQATILRLESTSTLAEECAKEGKDWREQLYQKKLEKFMEKQIERDLESQFGFKLEEEEQEAENADSDTEQE